MTEADGSGQGKGKGGKPPRDRTRFPLDLIGNRLYELHAAGVDLSRPIAVRFVSNFTHAAQAGAFKAAATELCDSIRALDFADSAAGASADIDIVLRFVMVASHAAIRAREARLASLAAEFGGTLSWYAYDPREDCIDAPASPPQPPADD
jgi:hypothetical protein